LLTILSRMLRFRYEIRLVRDGKYGTITENGTWNGMIEELTRGVSLRLSLRAVSFSRLTRQPVVDVPTVHFCYRLPG